MRTGVLNETTALCLKALLKLSATEQSLVRDSDAFPVVAPYCFHFPYEDYMRFQELAGERSSEDTHTLCQRMYVEPHREFLSTFWDHLIGADEDAIGDQLLQMASTFRMSYSAQQLREWTEGILRRCREVVVIPRQLDIYFAVGAPSFSTSRGFVQHSRPVIGIALDHCDGQAADAERGKEVFHRKMRVPTAREYCRALLSLEGFSPSNLLEALWEEGVAIAFSQEVFPGQELAEYLGMTAGELKWCERNEQYLWQGVRPNLESYDRDLKRLLLGDGVERESAFPRGVWRFLSYKLMANYQARMGKRTWKDLRKTEPWAFLGQWTSR